MTGRDDARYRSGLSQRSLSLSRDELATGRPREAALFARGAIEHAIKAIGACFGPVPRTHEPGHVLDAATASSAFPAELRPRAAALRPKLDAYGTAEHLLLSYGDGKARIDPWTLITRTHAEESVLVAGESVDLADDCIAILFGR
jgi:HEPN domain-containing protein